VAAPPRARTIRLALAVAAVLVLGMATVAWVQDGGDAAAAARVGASESAADQPAQGRPGLVAEPVASRPEASAASVSHRAARPRAVTRPTRGAARPARAALTARSVAARAQAARRLPRPRPRRRPRRPRPRPPRGRPQAQDAGVGRDARAAG